MNINIVLQVTLHTLTIGQKSWHHQQMVDKGFAKHLADH